MLLEFQAAPPESLHPPSSRAAAGPPGRASSFLLSLCRGWAVSSVGLTPPPAAVPPPPLRHRDPGGLSAPGCPGPVPCRTLCPSGGFVHGGAQRARAWESVQPPVRQRPCRPHRGSLGNQVSCRWQGGARSVGTWPAFPQDAPRAAREGPRPVGLRRPGVGPLGATGRGRIRGSRRGAREEGRGWAGPGAGPARRGRARSVGSVRYRASSAQPRKG